jgi:alanyl-tRNA synthetase
VTRLLYQEDPYVAEFKSRVTEVLPRGESFATVLEGTCFYPTSGGQPCDTGHIEDLPIVEVLEEGGRVLHISRRRPGYAPGDLVRARIDPERRRINMQQHTGQHILSAAFLKGLDAATVSSRLGTEHSTIDIAREDLSWDEARRVERLANSIVYEDRPVLISETPATEAEGLRIKRPVDREVLRVVEVEGFDRSPCGGTHTRRSGEVGPIKILRCERVRDTTRVEFVCGRLAEDDYFWKSRFVVELAQALTTKDTEIPRLVRETYE